MSDSQTASKPLTLKTREIFLRWERWRLGYNFVLIALTLGLAVAVGESSADWKSFAFQCIVGAFIANACYFAGPISEAYLHWLGIRHRMVAPALFFGGLLVAGALASITVLTALPIFLLD